MAFKDSDIRAFQREAAQAGTVSVHGLENVLSNMSSLAHFVVRESARGGKRGARAVLTRALRHVPYDKGELFKSGRILDTAGEEDDLDSDMISPTFITKGKYGPKAVVEWRVAFGDASVEYAETVHENANGVTFKQGTGPYPGDVKTAHFLSNAAQMEAAFFKQTVAEGFAEGIRLGVAAVKNTPPPTALTSKVGAPRLVKRK